MPFGSQPTTCLSKVLHSSSVWKPLNCLVATHPRSSSWNRISPWRSPIFAFVFDAPWMDSMIPPYFSICSFSNAKFISTSSSRDFSSWISSFTSPNSSSLESERSSLARYSSAWSQWHDVKVSILRNHRSDACSSKSGHFDSSNLISSCTARIFSMESCNFFSRGWMTD